MGDPSKFAIALEFVLGQNGRRKASGKYHFHFGRRTFRCSLGRAEIPDHGISVPILTEWADQNQNIESGDGSGPSPDESTLISGASRTAFPRGQTVIFSENPLALQKVIML
jgi:hypothetical protein